jgi:hypothetical protein
MSASFGLGLDSFPDPLLDRFTGAKAAWSFRRLRSAYNGSCVTLRRASDNAEQTFGFAGMYVDLAAIESFLPSGVAYVKTWFDQSGNGYDLSMATAANQPQITKYESTLNNRQVVSTTGNSAGSATQKVLDATMASSSSAWSLFVACNIQGSISTSATAHIFDSSSGRRAIGFNSNGRYGWYNGTGWVDSGTAGATGAQHLLYNASGTTGTIYKNGASIGTAAWSQTTLASVRLFGNLDTLSNNGVDGRWGEIILYTSDQSANLAAIYADQKAYFGLP